jgi:hypothetical protein
MELSSTTLCRFFPAHQRLGLCSFRAHAAITWMSPAYRRLLVLRFFWLQFFSHESNPSVRSSRSLPQGAQSGAPHPSQFLVFSSKPAILIRAEVRRSISLSTREMESVSVLRNFRVSLRSLVFSDFVRERMLRISFMEEPIRLRTWAVWIIDMASSP